ncbi:MAG: type IV pilin [Methanomicrobiaceae archaeon]|nr:type IV pilin [Methanomicrobiaceae archaeon]
MREMSVMICLEKNNEAVSPVVGVMLMLVVTIIIAAVVSGFAGGIVGGSNTGSATEIVAQTKIINTGEDLGSRFEIDILSASPPVSTKDLKLKTSWKTYEGGNLISECKSTMPGSDNFDCNGNKGVAPIGIDPGLSVWDRADKIEDDMSFGKYALMAGTRMYAYPAEEYDGYSYNDFSGIDSMQAVLGEEWYKLKSGDVVSVMLIYVPTGQIIYDEDVFVNGS